MINHYPCYDSTVVLETFRKIRKVCQACIHVLLEVFKLLMRNDLTLCFPGTKLQWSSAITLVVFIWLFTAFWSAMPLIGWGEYDYEPLRTCCTLDYTKGDR